LQDGRFEWTTIGHDGRKLVMKEVRIFLRGTVIAVGLILLSDAAWGQRIYWAHNKWVENQVQRGSRYGGVTPANIFDQATARYTEVFSIELDVANGKMYWADSRLDRAIKVGNMDGTGPVTTLFSTVDDGTGQPWDMAIDVAGGKVYWINQQSPMDSILVGNIDGTGSPVVVYDETDGLDNPRQLALDIGAGKVYWTEFSDRIMAGNMDGSGIPAAVFDNSDGLVNPDAIALDPASGKMYFTVFGTGLFMVANLDGSGTPQARYPSLAGTIGITDIAIDPSDNSIYWTDILGEKVQKASLFGIGTPVDLFTAADGLDTPQAIAIDFSGPPGVPLPTATNWILAVTGLLLGVAGMWIVFRWRIRSRSTK
jgi:hypothetical protein